MRLLTLTALDGRTVAARRAAALTETFAAEFGAELTPAQRIRVETAAALSAIAEDAQTRRLAGDASITLDDLVRAVSAARRAVRDLGLDRKRPPSGPTLSEYLASRRAEQTEDSSADEESTGEAGDETTAGELPDGSGEDAKEGR